MATLVLNRDGRGNNVLDLSDRSSITGAFSELTMLAQGHGQGKKSGKLEVIDVDDQSAEAEDDDDADAIYDSTGSAENGFHGLRSTVRDSTVPFYRPQIMVAGDADNQAQVDYRARKAMADARLNGFDLTAIVKGHRMDNGQLWQPASVFVSEASHMALMTFTSSWEESFQVDGQTTPLPPCVSKRTPYGYRMLIRKNANHVSVAPK